MKTIQENSFALLSKWPKIIAFPLIVTDIYKYVLINTGFIKKKQNFC